MGAASGSRRSCQEERGSVLVVVAGSGQDGPGRTQVRRCAQATGYSQTWFNSMARRVPARASWRRMTGDAALKYR